MVVPVPTGTTRGSAGSGPAAAPEEARTSVVKEVREVLGVVDQRVKGDLKRFKEFIEQRGRVAGGRRGRISPG
jgi:hypothetical protein